MEHFQTLQHLDRHTIITGVFQCFAVLVVLAVVAIKLFRSF